MKKSIAILALIAPLLLGAAAFAQDHSGHGRAPAPKAEKSQAKQKTDKAKAEPRKVTAQEVGKDAACAVTGEKFKVEENTISMSYKGEVYYFCCPGCDKKFAENPEKYAKKKNAAAKKYVCPMGCAESDKPGKCPKCGMNLAEKKPAAEAKK